MAKIKLPKKPPDMVIAERRWPEGPSLAYVAWRFKQFERVKTSGEAAKRSLGERQLRNRLQG